MKQIETKEIKERKATRNKTIIGVILAVLMLLSTVGYAFFSMEKADTSPVQKVRYNNLDFYKQGDFWQVQVSGYAFYFYYLPNETEKVFLNRTLKDYNGKPLYFVNEGAAEQEVARNLVSFVSRMQQACLENESCTDDAPMKTCTDNILIIKEESSLTNTIVRQEDNCIFILSNNTIRSADSFVYRVLGVI